MKRVFIIHGWDFNPKINWYPWLKKELEKRNFHVKVPTMPNTSEPKINEWVSHLKKIAGKIDEETFFIGHSIGCQTIMRFLQNENQKVGGAVFVAGWFKLANLEDDEVKKIAAPWLETPIDFAAVKKNINKLTVILSSNEPYNFLEENSEIFKNKLGAEIIIEKDKGYFTKDDGVLTNETALRELMEVVK